MWTPMPPTRPSSRSSSTIVERHRESRGSFADPPGVYWEWDTTRDTDGPHRLEAVLSDYLGNTEHTCRITVNVFNGIPPTVTIERPADGTVVHGTVGISARAVDDVRVVSLGLFLDGTSIAAAQGSSSSLSAEAVWDTADAANGLHEIKAVARDNDGLEASRVIHVEVKIIVLTLDVSVGVDRAWLIRKDYGLVKLTVDNTAGLDVARYRSVAVGGRRRVSADSGSPGRECHRKHPHLP